MYEINPELIIQGSDLDPHEWVLVYRNSGRQKKEKTSSEDLLALKIVSENLNLVELSRTEGVTVENLHNLLDEACKKGILIKSEPLIKRDKSTCEVFTLQWHITNACDLHCKHCYDRAKRSPLTLEQGEKVLSDFYEFCENKNVRGHVCFSGGNPFLSNIFVELYKKTVDYGFSTSILGNPVSEGKLKQILEIKKPSYFQVSLEGLKEHNDYIRGEGFFDRVLEFLPLLRKHNVSSTVMLTLTKDNMEQVIPLAEILEERVDCFTFNRLSQSGEGENLLMADIQEYNNFLKEYIKKSKKIKNLAYKDNLINTLLKSPFEGCTGFGCGAAFNFVTILPDNEVHACRKFPSPIGNIAENSLLEIYDSKESEKYRQGCSECTTCKLKPACGGCLAIAKSFNLDIFNQKDPYCLYKEKKGIWNLIH